MNILVTGGSGFIGSYVVDRLVADGHNVLVFARSYKMDDPRPQVRHFLGDIRDETAVFEAVAHADAFIHLAGVLGTQETIHNPKPAFETNIFGGINILEAASRYAVPGVNIAVGNHWENNPYSISKSTVERLVHMYNRERGTQVGIVRALNAYGPRQSVAAPYGSSKVRKIIPSFVSRALAGDLIEIYGTGSQIMDMVHVRDVADILVDTLGVVIDSGDQTVNLPVIDAGTGVETSVGTVAVEVLKAVYGPLSFEEIDSKLKTLPMRPGETASRPVLADTSTLVHVYGDYSKGFISLKKGIQETVEYYRNA